MRAAVAVAVAAAVAVAVLLLLLLLLLHAVLGVRLRSGVHRWPCAAEHDLARREHGHGGASAHDPGVLGPPALARVHDEAALAQGDPGQSPGQNPDVLAVVDREGTQVHVAPHHRLVHPGGGRRERDDALRDPGPGVRLDVEDQLVELGAGGRGADDEALAARAVHPLEHELVPAAERVLAHGVVHQVHRLDVVEDGILAEVVADHGRHVGVDHLVVGHSVADAVGNGDPSRPGRVHHAGTADERLRSELQWVEVVVVDPPVDHVHRHLALGRAQEDVGPMADEVSPLDQVHAHEPGQQRVLVEGRVVHAGGQDDDGRVLHRGGGGAAQRVDEPCRVVGHHLNGLAPEQLGQDTRHGRPVGQDVAHSRRAPQVVLEHPELAVLVADDVDARHVDAHPVGWRQSEGGADETGGAGDDIVRDQAVAHDPGSAVDVGEELLERPHALGHTVGDPRPLLRGEDARHDVERERPLLAVEVEGDALIHEGPRQPRGPDRDVFWSHLGQRRGHARVRRPGRAGAVYHLVERVLGQSSGGSAIAVEQVAHGPQRARHVFRRRFATANGR